MGVRSGIECGGHQYSRLVAPASDGNFWSERLKPWDAEGEGGEKSAREETAGFRVVRVFEQAPCGHDLLKGRSLS